MKSVEELDVFKLAHELALTTYSTTKLFPREETFSLVDQMRRLPPRECLELPSLQTFFWLSAVFFSHCHAVSFEQSV